MAIGHQDSASAPSRDAPSATLAAPALRDDTHATTASGEDAQHDSQHLENPSRTSDEGSARYPGNEDDEDRALLLGLGATDEATEGLIRGAEAVEAWKEMSPTGRMGIYIAFGLLGAGVLLPFNVVITPTEYYRARFLDTPFARSFANWLIVSFNFTAIVFQATATRSLPKTTPAQRIGRSGTILLATLAGFTLITAFGPGNIPDPTADTRGADVFYFVALLVCANILAAACAYFQNAVVALSSAFGPLFMGTMLAFQGLIAVVTSVIQLMAAVSFVRSRRLAPAPSPVLGTRSVDTESSQATITFLVISVALMGSVLFAFRLLTRTELYWEVHYKEAGSSSWARVEGDLAGEGEIAPDGGASWALIANLNKKLWFFFFAMVINFVVTLALFPAATSRITSSSAREGTLLASPLVFASLHFFLFNLSDVIGRTLPSFLSPRWAPRRPWSVLTFALARIVFVPLFQGAHTGPTSPVRNAAPFMASSPASASIAVPPVSMNASEMLTSSLNTVAQATSASWPPAGPAANASAGLTWMVARVMQHVHVPSPGLLEQDWVFFLMLFVFGASNGYLITNLFVYTPIHPGLDQEEKKLAASVLSFWLAIGLALGSAFSFAVQK